MAQTRPSDVPAALWHAIIRAARKYHVDPYVLAGIWRIESGSSYPDTSVNQQGYGGLFGTQDYNGSVQSQANTSASILARLLHQYGNYPKALSHYSGGAYASVPGVSSSSASGGGGNVFPKPYNPNDTKVTQVDQGVDFVSASPYTAVASGRVVHIDPNFYRRNGLQTAAVYIRLDHPVTVDGRTYRGVYYAETRPLVHVGQHVRPGQKVIAPGDAEIGFAAQFGRSSSSWLPAAHGHYTEGFPTAEGGDFNVAIGNKGGDAGAGGPVVSAITGAAGAVASPFEAIAGIVGKLTSAAFWLRAAEVIGGGILILLGLYLLARQIGLAPDAVPTPIGQLPLPGKSKAQTLADQAATAASTQQFREREAKERRAEESHQAQLEERAARADLARARAETTRSGRTTNQYYLDTPPSTRRQQLAARSSDPATNEIPY